MKLMTAAVLLAVSVILAAAGVEGINKGKSTFPDLSDTVSMPLEEFVSLCWLNFTANPKAVTALAEVKAWMAQRRDPSSVTCKALLNTRFDCFQAMFHVLPSYTNLGAINMQTFCFSLHNKERRAQKGKIVLHRSTKVPGLKQ